MPESFAVLTILAKPETKMSLPIALFRCVKMPFFTTVIARCFLIFFRYSQPVLINRSIQYVVAYPTDPRESHCYWLVVSAVSIYVGLAVRYISLVCLSGD